MTKEERIAEIQHCLTKNGYRTDTPVAICYISEMADCFDLYPDNYTTEDWFKDTLANYPEELEMLGRR